MTANAVQLHDLNRPYCIGMHFLSAGSETYVSCSLDTDIIIWVARATGTVGIGYRDRESTELTKR